MTLTEFLLARIAEDETHAVEVQRHIDRWDRETVLNGPDGSQGSVVVTLVHTAPKRVLAECEAKRRIVGIHRDESLDGDTEDDLRHYEDFPEERPRSRCAECSCYGDCVVSIDECRTLRTLAAVYADHPDYRQEWKLDG